MQIYVYIYIYDFFLLTIVRYMLCNAAVLTSRSLNAQWGPMALAWRRGLGRKLG